MWHEQKKDIFKRSEILTSVTYLYLVLMTKTIIAEDEAEKDNEQIHVITFQINELVFKNFFTLMVGFWSQVFSDNSHI